MTQKSSLMLDISKLTNIKSGSVFVELDKKFDEIFENYQIILDRAKMTLSLIQRIDFQNGDIKKSEGYFRAAMCEFVSIDEVQEKLCNNKRLKIYDTKHPLLILFKLLRNIEVHLQTRRLSKEEKEVLWGKDRKQITMTIYVPEKIKLEQLQKLRTYKKNFSSTENENTLIDTINWFNKEVSDWGILELVRKAVHEYLEEIRIYNEK